MQMSISLNQPWPYLFTLQILLAMTLMSSNMESVSANADTPEIPTVSDNENEFMMDNDEDFPHQFDKREAKDWQQMMHPWGKREANFYTDMMENGEMVPFLAYFTNPAINYEDGDLDDENILNEKRGWKKLNVAWGKRRNSAPYMNKDFVPSASASGSWGKRQPNWNNLKGMWGKRAADKWNKLGKAWGKRSAQLTETN